MSDAWWDVLVCVGPTTDAHDLLDSLMPAITYMHFIIFFLVDRLCIDIYVEEQKSLNVSHNLAGRVFSRGNRLNGRKKKYRVNKIKSRIQLFLSLFQAHYLSKNYDFEGYFVNKLCKH